MFERYTEEARRTIHDSKCEADRLGSDELASEHILLVLLNDARLSSLLLEGRRIQDARDEILARVTVRPLPSLPRDIPFGEDARQTLLLAVEEADRLGDRYVGNRHILLGLLRVENGIAPQLLHDRGLSADKVRSRITARDDHG